MMLFVGVPFTVIAVRGRAFLQASAAQLYVAVGALIVSAIVATEWPLVLWVLVIALETMIIAGLPSPRRVNLSARPTKLLIVSTSPYLGRRSSEPRRNRPGGGL